jgi:Ca2+-binding RTX toxin-like protein
MLSRRSSFSPFSTQDLQIIDLGSEVRSNGSVVHLDDPTDGAATIIPGAGHLSELQVTGAFSPNDRLDIDSTGSVSLPGGLNDGSVVSVDQDGTDVPIGTIAIIPGGFKVVFYDGTTPAQVQELLRALTYSNVSNETVVVEPREIDIRLWDDAGSLCKVIVPVITAPDDAIILSYAAENRTGTDQNDVFVVNHQDKLWGDNLNGGAGDEDTLYLGGSWSFDLTELSGFTGIEIIRGTSQGEYIKIGQEQFARVTTIDGGPNSIAAYDTLGLFGDVIDFAGKSILNFDVIELGTQNSVVTVYDVATALSLGAGWGTRGTHLKLQGGATLESDQIAALHDAGIDKVTVGNGPTSTNEKPVATGLDGERVGVRAGETVRLEQGPATFQIEDDDAVLGSLIVAVELSSTSYYQLGIAETDDVSVESNTNRVFVDDQLIGYLWSSEDGYLEVGFYEGATHDRVEKLVKALTYKNTAPAGTSFEDMTVSITVLDKGTRSATSTVTVFNVEAPQNHAPADVRLSGQTSVSVAENSAFTAALSATDADNDALTFLFDTGATGGGNAGGMFVIDNATKQLKLAPGKTLDFETAQSFTVYVKADDGRGGVSATQALTIKVTDVVEALVGTSRANTLVGGAGSDKLYGKGGKDVLTGNGGQDIFVFDTKANTKTNRDTITDYSVADDTIWLSKKVFAKLGKKGSEASPAKLSKAFFKVADKAKDKNDYVIYNKKTGVLSYDVDGSGSVKAVEIAKLAKNLKLTQDDFFIV